jgi:type III secretion system FlhB-like substrate exporter
VLADKIIETAKENDVPLYKDNKLADTLSKLKIGDRFRRNCTRWSRKSSCSWTTWTG